MKIAAITRNPKNSPNMAEKDLAILQSTATLLRNRGITVDILKESEYTGQEYYDIIFHMSRNDNTLAMLEQAQKNGARVINSASAVRQCEREAFTMILHKNNIAQPPYHILDNNSLPPETGYPMWLKKCKGWSCHPHDVCMATNKDETQEAINSFRARGTQRILCCKHIQGDIVKFYGVADKFFHWQYPDAQKTKFGLEKLNGAIQRYTFDCDKLKSMAHAAAQAIGIEIFGGDCIITPEGDIVIIDFNDFPSFSACHNEAASAIADIITTPKTDNE